MSGGGKFVGKADDGIVGFVSAQDDGEVLHGSIMLCSVLQ